MEGVDLPRFRASIMKRSRGVWLVDVMDHETGDLDFDAFPSLAKAKRWAVRKMMVQRVRWTDKAGVLYAEAWDHE